MHVSYLLDNSSMTFYSNSWNEFCKLMFVKCLKGTIFLWQHYKVTNEASLQKVRTRNVAILSKLWFHTPVFGMSLSQSTTFLSKFISLGTGMKHFLMIVLLMVDCMLKCVWKCLCNCSFSCSWKVPVNAYLIMFSCCI